MKTVVHVTHEATHKVGGIGTVLEGLLTSADYQAGVNRSILVGTWLLGTPLAERLGSDSELLYCVCDGVDRGNWRRVFRPIEDFYHVWITYGLRRFRDRATGRTAEAELLLIEATEMDPARLNYIKATIYQRFGIPSGNYEMYSDYIHWLKIGDPAYDAVMALTDAQLDDDQDVFFVSHEYMGMATALKAETEGEPNVYSIFYAHETATVRPHVENHEGHDTRFYNLMWEAKKANLHIGDVLGNQWHSYRHALIDRSQYCDAVFAVGDEVVEEMRFLSPAFDNAPIRLVYNGIPCAEITLKDKKASKEKLVQYSENLYGFRPDYVFTHVTRLVTSKGLWRDIRVLFHLDKLLAEAGKSAVLYLLTTEIGRGRTGDEARWMEGEYGWPRYHRTGYPDLLGGEVTLNGFVEGFNLHSRAAKVVFVNQFGWSRDRCGNRMPEDMEFHDIRKGSDAEFGQSIYEPFGIAQVEPLSFGAICVVSNVCGCVGFEKEATGGKEVPNVIVADYTTLGGGHIDVHSVSQIGLAERDWLENEQSEKVAAQLFERLPKNDKEIGAMLKRGYQIAQKMSWDVVARDYFLPGLDEVVERRHKADDGDA